MAETKLPMSPAPLWKHLCAMGYDSLLLLALSMAYSALHLYIKAQLYGVGSLKTAKAGHAGDPLLFIGVVLCWALFYSWFWTRSGQTLGMQAWRLRLEQENGERVTARQAIVRLMAAVVSLACVGLGYAWCLGKQRRCWHDLASQTRVVVLPKPVSA